MRILYITNEIPYPLQTGYMRQYRFLEALSKHHTITHYSLTWRPYIPSDAISAVNRFSERLEIFGLPGPSEPWVVRAAGMFPLIGERAQRGLRARLAAREMKRAILKLVRKESFDLVFFSGKDTFPAIEDLANLPIVADCCDAAILRLRGEIKFSGLSRRAWLLCRYLEMKRIEKRLVKKTPHVIFGSLRDREALLTSNESGVVIPQGIDPDHWKRGSNQIQRNCLVFVGSMSYPSNHDAAVYLIEKILPLVRKTIPDVELFVVGRDPLPALRLAAGRSTKVTVTGRVEDIRPYLERAAVFAAPIRFASGIQNKILEALAMGVPVVTTSVVAAGLRVKENIPLPLCIGDTEKQFAEQVVGLLHGERERARLAVEGRRYVESHFLWSESLSRLEQMCLEAARTNGRSGTESATAGGQPCLQSR